MAEQLINNKYKMRYPSVHKLINSGFRRSKNADDEVWNYTFPVYKYKRIPTIECTVSVFMPNGDVRLNVYSNGQLYSPFYYIEFGNYEPIMNIINNNILQELNKLDVKKKKEKEE